MTLPTYILITAARNEAQFIELTLKSVVGQTVKPLKWVIVSDGSTDGTEEIVRRYAAEHPWMELMRMPDRPERHFAGKARAVNAAYAAIRHLQFQAVGSLDADVALEDDHFAYLLGRLAENPALGIVGTAFHEPGSPDYDYRFATDENVPGPCQLFRRECFEEIGGYAPLKYGGVDHFALIRARMRGWKTKAFTHRSFLHCRPMGSALYAGLGAIFFAGVKDHALGNHPLWQFLRAGYRMTHTPILLGGVLLGAGYLYAAMWRRSREVPREWVQFHQREEWYRLKVLLKRFCARRAGKSRSLIGAERAAGKILSPPPASTARVPVYVLITPARNEAQFIESTIRAVVAQTVRPLKWMIVSDGSTDGTDEIVRKYAAVHPWIELMRMPERRDRSFGGKAHAVNAAYSAIRDLEFQVVVNLDADISIGENHFACLLSKLAADPSLGLVGAPFREASDQTYDYRFVSIEHVSGACQVFRRECFEDINGYMPIPGGGVDQAAVVTARMKGWKTRTFTEVVCLHHRKIGSAEHGTCAAYFRIGVKDYRMGGHPLWEFARVLYRTTKKPFLGGLFLGAGYLWATVRRIARPLPPELQAFHRREQMRRLKKFFAPDSAPNSTPAEVVEQVGSLRHVGNPPELEAK